MNTALSKKTRLEKWQDHIEERYSLFDDTCLEAIRKLRQGDTFAFAAFAKNVRWWESQFRPQIINQEKVGKAEYQRWKKAYDALPQEVREQTEAKLPF